MFHSHIKYASKREFTKYIQFVDGRKEIAVLPYTRIKRFTMIAYLLDWGLSFDDVLNVTKHIGQWDTEFTYSIRILLVHGFEIHALKFISYYLIVEVLAVYAKISFTKYLFHIFKRSIRTWTDSLCGVHSLFYIVGPIENTNSIGVCHNTE